MILLQDRDWLAVNKPNGLATHAGRPGELGVVEWLDLHLGLTTHVVSRLDRGTSGVLLLARHPAAAARAEQIHETGAAAKTYEFLSAADSAEMGIQAQWECREDLDGKQACTVFTRLGRSTDRRWTHYRAELSRGRRHQIRRHAQASGIPLLGDEQYGGAPFARLCLHCVEVRWPELPDPVQAPLPDSLTALLGRSHDDPYLAACADRRGRWLAPVTDALRAVHRDEIPDLPIAVDIYGPWFSAVWFDEDSDPARLAERLAPVLARVQAGYGCRGGVVRTHRRNPHQRSLVTEVSVVGDRPPEVFQVSEHGFSYDVNLLTTQHTGLFLDQRDTRRRLALRAGDARLANLFAFTCSFSVVAVRHGAEVAFSVDTARPCLTTGMGNFARNGLAASGRGKFIQEDVRRWLARQARRKAQDGDGWRGLDLVVCDPPVFASARDGGQFSLEQEWPHLASACAQLLTPGGAAIFANNHRTGDHRTYREALAAVFGEVTDLRPPLDFPVLAGHTHHVRTFWCEKPLAGT